MQAEIVGPVASDRRGPRKAVVDVDVVAVSVEVATVEVAEGVGPDPELGAKTIDLTSRPSREAANKLYQKLGFEQRETNIYRFKS